MQMVAIGFLLAGPAGDKLMRYYLQDFGLFTYVGLLLLWISALITVYTGYDYFRAGLRHLMGERDREARLFRLGARADRPRSGGGDAAGGACARPTSSSTG